LKDESLPSSLVEASIALSEQNGNSDDPFLINDDDQVTSLQTIIDEFSSFQPPPETVNEALQQKLAKQINVNLRDALHIVDHYRINDVVPLLNDHAYVQRVLSPNNEMAAEVDLKVILGPPVKYICSVTVETFFSENQPPLIELAADADSGFNEPGTVLEALSSRPVDSPKTTRTEELLEIACAAPTLKPEENGTGAFDQKTYRPVMAIISDDSSSDDEPEFVPGCPAIKTNSVSVPILNGLNSLSITFLVVFIGCLDTLDSCLKN
ncbi:unnamed protein product, partial [Dibothriocephalus latus]